MIAPGEPPPTTPSRAWRLPCWLWRHAMASILIGGGVFIIANTLVLAKIDFWPALWFTAGGTPIVAPLLAGVAVNIRYRRHTSR